MFHVAQTTIMASLLSCLGASLSNAGSVSCRDPNSSPTNDVDDDVDDDDVDDADDDR